MDVLCALSAGVHVEYAYKRMLRKKPKYRMRSSFSLVMAARAFKFGNDKIASVPFALADDWKVHDQLTIVRMSQRKDPVFFL